MNCWPCVQVELDDLISCGTIGLIKAVDRFDPSRNLKLKTLAERRIRGDMLDYLRQIDPLPRSVRRFQKRRDETIDTLSASGKVPHHEEIAEALSISMLKHTMLNRIVVAAEPIPMQE